MIIREAISEDAEVLTSLAIRSKAYWGYSDEFMQACTEELTLSPSNFIKNNIYYALAELDNKVIGFYALELQSEDEVELEALFVDPDYIGCGVGTTLIERAKFHAASLGAKKMNIQGDPNAERFYISVGGELVGRKESVSIAGRFLPMFQILLSN